jgi:hypothetical protein
MVLWSVTYTLIVGNEARMKVIRGVKILELAHAVKRGIHHEEIQNPKNCIMYMRGIQRDKKNSPVTDETRMVCQISNTKFVGVKNKVDTIAPNESKPH